MRDADTTWMVLDKQSLLSVPPWLDVYSQRVVIPDGRIVESYLQIELLDYVVVFAETVEDQVLMLRQYKHGLRRTSLTLPGGLIDRGEEPLAAAIRELREETGYEAEHWHALGSFTVNGNYGCGTAHFFRCCGCRAVTEANSGDLETMKIIRFSLNEVRATLGNGEIALLSHATGVSLALQSRQT